MADDTAQQVAEAVAEQGDPAPETARPKPILWILLLVAVVGVAAGAGLGLGTVLRRADASDRASEPPMPTDESKAQAAKQEYEYHKFPPVIATLNTERRERYIKVEIWLAIRPGDFKAASSWIQKKEPELKSWLYVYLGGCTLEDVGGKQNPNRLLRVIQDEFNDRLWPDGRGLIHHVVYGDYKIQ